MKNYCIVTKFVFQHKTTLGEAEIQSAVEAAAGLFKKVVIQRRNAKKAAEEGRERSCFYLPLIKFSSAQNGRSILHY